MVGALLPLALCLLATMARASVITVSDNTLRTGWDTNEPALTPARVASAAVGKLFETSLPKVVGNSQSGLQPQQILAQPLIADGYLIIATEENRVYGLDPVTGAIKWSRDLGPSWPVASIDCHDLVPDNGETSTPVYDASNKTLYVLDVTYDDKPSGVSKPSFQLHGLDIANGRDRKGWPVTIEGDPTNSPNLPFTPLHELQRGGLLLLGGVVYVGFGGHCNPLMYGSKGDVNGYVVGVSATRARLTTIWSTEAGYSSGSGDIWQSGGGLVSDGPGSIFVATGDGLIAAAVGPGDRPPATLSDAVIHLRVQPNGSLKAVDFFSPTNGALLDRDDTDLASGGPMAIPAGYGTSRYPDLLVEDGKDGRVWLLNRDDLGGVGQGKGRGNGVLGETGPFSGVWGHPAFFGGNRGYVYYVTNQGPMDAFELGAVDGVPRLSLAGQTVVPGVFGYRSGSPSVTSTGRSPGTGLVWVVYSTGPSGAYGTLNAYDAVPVHGVLKLVRSWPIGTVSEFSNVTTNDGRVYVGNKLGQVLCFGTISATAGSPIGAASLQFGSVPVGHTATANVVLTATRTVTVKAFHLYVPFAIGSGAPTLPVLLKQGQRLVVPVVFHPIKAVGAWAYLYAVTGDGTVPVETSGVGTTVPTLAVSSPALSFGSEPTGQPSQAQSVQITNAGARPETITSLLTPPASSGFLVQGLPAVGSTLEPGTSATVTVSYAPSRVGAARDSLSVRSGSVSATVHLTGSATAGTRHLSISVGTLSFGKVRVGSSVTKTFELDVTGTDDLSVWTVRLPSEPFRAENPLASGSGLIPDSPVPVTVLYRPTAAGRFSETYVFDARDGQGRQTISLVGAAVR